MNDPFRLQRFVDAQASVHEAVQDELRAGCKRSHWMWFIFPQIAGLGHSATAREFAIASLAEARAYLAHPILGPRLRECCALVAAHARVSAEDIFGHVDAMKWHSSLTLFGQAAPDESVFATCLDRYFGAVPDPATLALLRA